ncbi:MAG: DegT/DnrJ/EryC1/StrS family aminotransferase [Candidatus Eremiobacteraeota bacterium]|nr:DegT/DnrJ/EryC1/StrS family aminotransferase [Candidatus Eremiobacteraeota bacterium]
MIPILDLRQQYLELKPQIDAAINDVLLSGHFIMGPNVREFEQEISTFLGVPHALALNSGTDALHLALRALDIGPGDEIITTPFTFVATTEAIGIVDAKVVFADIDPLTYNIDPRCIEGAITPRTKAIMPVHLYGLPAAMPEIMAIAKRHDLYVVEDCAQAIGATVTDRQVGTFGDVACFSFFPSKNLGAYGDGGLVTTKEERIAKRLNALRVHGGPVKYFHEELGVNSRLDELQAAILRVKLPHLSAWTEKRRAIARRYDAAFGGLPDFAVPTVPPGYGHIYHQYTVRFRDRDAVKDQLTEAGVQTMIYYPRPLHLQTVHRSLGLGLGSFPVAEAAAAEVLSLPMYPEFDETDQKRVIEAVADVLKAAVA